MIMDVTEIQKLLPHRYPFLLVDRVTEFVAGERLTAIKNVTMNEQFFGGHFPGHPVMPGVLILEAMAQASALLAIRSDLETYAEKLTFLMAIDNAKFRRPVVPGDQLKIQIEVIRRKGDIWRQKGVATVDGLKVAEAEFLATMADKEESKTPSAS